MDFDLFASRLNKQLPRFASWRPDPEAEVTDVFSLDWTKVTGYAFPPFALLGRCLRKVVSQTRPVDCSCCPAVEGTTMVPGASEPRSCTAAPPPESTRPSDRSSRGPPSSDGQQQPDVGRVAALRDRLAREGISAQAADLLMASWRPGTERAYRSAWQQWTSWCSQREISPLCPSLGEVLDFLTELFHRGRQYRTLSGYRSALSMTLSPINGVLVGQHPLVSRLLKGAYHSRPPQPRYRFTWDVEMVLRHLRAIDTSSLKNLTSKTLMLLALASAGRVADLFLCDTRFITVTEEKAVLGLAGLRKTQRVGQAAQALEVTRLAEDAPLCPVASLDEYLQRTAGHRGSKTQLFLSIRRPFGPVSKATLARWMCELLAAAGVVANFTAHSVRGAATSAALAKGLSVAEILKAADWRRVSTFRKYYSRTLDASCFGTVVLSTQNSGNSS